MLYFCSDIHGEYDLFMRLLQYIGFSQNDTMIVCGDIIDKGQRSIQLLNLIAKNDNFVFLMGNHEFDFLKYYHYLMKDRNGNYEEVLQKLEQYLPGDTGLTWELMDWLESQPYYIETDSYICVHSGIPVMPNNTLMNVEEAKVNQLVYDRRFKDPSVLPKTDKCILFGHTPTNYLTGKHEIIGYPKIAEPKKISDFTKIHLDIGTWLGGGVGCLCAETLKCHYVTAQSQTYTKQLI